MERGDRAEAERAPTGRGEWVVRGLGAVLTLAAGIPWLLLVAVVLRARFGEPGWDPHGYVRVTGTVLAVPAGLLTALGAGLVAPRRLRARVLLLATLIAVLVAVLLVLALATTPPWVPPGARFIS